MRLPRLIRQLNENVPGRLQVMGLNHKDAILALLLAARIHKTDNAIRATAKRCMKQLPRGKRDLIFTVLDSREPLKLVNHIANNLQ